MRTFSICKQWFEQKPVNNVFLPKENGGEVQFVVSSSERTLSIQIERDGRYLVRITYFTSVA